MIKILHKEDCCGCEACREVCPRQCISMQRDGEGFLYPVVDASLCVDCGACERVCPVINRAEISEPLRSYAAKHREDSLRRESSSGGVFSLLASEVLKGGGVVFGAVFNANWEVEHSYTETLEGLAAMRQSKYSQSRIGGMYAEVKRFLKDGKRVLFSGTPCQISGLKKYLGREYDGLLVVDCACHGVPSAKVFDRYLDEKNSEQTAVCRADISSVSFRDKTLGIENLRFEVKTAENVVVSEPTSVNPFMRGFHNDLYLRPSCYNCPVKGGRSSSDITIADLWSIKKVAPKFGDALGVSLVVVNTQKGEDALPKDNADFLEVDFTESIEGNSGFSESLAQNPNREKFFAGLDHCDKISEHILNNLYQPKRPLIVRVKRKLNSILRK